MDRTILLCAGPGYRWNNYLGVPKHLISINGETLIERSVRLFSSKTVVYIVGNYEVTGAHTYIPPPKEQRNGQFFREHPEDKFLSSKDIWCPDGYSLFVFGDVYFTDAAAKTILDNYNQKFWMTFGRAHPSNFSGHEGGEVFALSISSGYLSKFEENVRKAGLVKKQGKRGCFNGLGWITYYFMSGQMPEDGWQIYPHFNNINDFTDDFDAPHQYNSWKRNWRKWNPFMI